MSTSNLSAAERHCCAFEPAPKLHNATAPTLACRGWHYVLGSRLELLTPPSSGECSTNWATQASEEQSVNALYFVENLHDRACSGRQYFLRNQMWRATFCPNATWASFAYQVTSPHQFRDWWRHCTCFYKNINHPFGAYYCWLLRKLLISLRFFRLPSSEVPDPPMDEYIGAIYQ